jgi:hypothetical protein
MLETPVGGLVCAVSWGQVFPRGASAQNPQTAFEHFAAIAPRAAPSVFPHRVRWQDGFDSLPLLVCQVHP